MNKCFVMILLGLLAFSVYADRPTPLRDVDIQQKLNQPVPLDLIFRDESGASVKLGKYFGSKPVILVMVYYQCAMLCPMTLDGVVRATRALSFAAGDQYQVVAVSFNPQETPALAAAKKAEYLRKYRRLGGEAGWHFLTGTDASIRPLTEAIGFHYHYDPETKQYAHATAIMVLTPTGRLSRYFYGVEYSARDLRLALIEASHNKIGTLADEVLLFCCRYDPATGKYGVVISRVIQLAGGVTVLTLGTFIGLMLWRERRHNRDGKVASRQREAQA
ncbi:MAG TPA: SCO family protein [Verrucomicrobiae bacterium]|nr:SCO family protein [Verrucomicrobiae bacterium]